MFSLFDLMCVLNSQKPNLNVQWHSQQGKIPYGSWKLGFTKSHPHKANILSFYIMSPDD